MYYKKVCSANDLDRWLRGIHELVVDDPNLAPCLQDPTRVFNQDKKTGVEVKLFLFLIFIFFKKNNNQFRAHHWIRQPVFELNKIFPKQNYFHQLFVFYFCRWNKHLKNVFRLDLIPRESWLKLVPKCCTMSVEEAGNI